MKKCPQCQREIDQHGIACQYCNEVDIAREKKQPSKAKSGPKRSDPKYGSR